MNDALCYIIRRRKWRRKQVYPMNDELCYIIIIYIYIMCVML
jgi:hypothetical protein